jgi:hypothetical protein
MDEGSLTLEDLQVLICCRKGIVYEGRTSVQGILEIMVTSESVLTYTADHCATADQI